MSSAPENAHRTWVRDGFRISTDPALLDMDAVHGFLTRSYWSPGITLDRVRAAAANSRCYGLYAPEGYQAGYARVVTDYVAHAYVCDVFVREPWRGRGLSKWLVGTICGDPDLQAIRRWVLFTRDAQNLYSRFGFGPIDDPNRLMIRSGGAA
ncbi:MAG TPA: GNAT family N-acetyltransferase [Azospirillaceae bacterium]|nr:GNAT family N-acetyltransferase [Azospirillaceae bacterium]